MKVYLASSWKNAQLVRDCAKSLRRHGHEVDDFADDSRGRYVFGFDKLPDISNHNAQTVFQLTEVQQPFAEDKKWIDWADCVLLLLPAGKSAHLEAGYAKGQGKKLIIFQLDFPKAEFDAMYGFADLITNDPREIYWYLNEAAKAYGLEELES